MPAHWDQLPWERHEHGELRCERQRLAAAAGSAGVGLSRFRIPAGRRPMPQHAHVDEEEIVFVLAGSGLSWQDDSVHEIAAGDAIVHRPSTQAHTLVAGDDGLEALVFGSGSPTQLTTLPRAGVTWVGPRWLPADAPHPFAAEPPLGAPLPPPSPRPPTIVALAEIEPRVQREGRVQRTVRDLGRAAGSLRSGLVHVEVAAGGRSSVRHCHSLEEELFVVLGGAGTLLLGDAEHAVRAGSIVARPPGTGVAHSFAAGPGGLTLLAYGTREHGDLCWYPDSQKIAFRGLKVIARVQPLGYWDGEA